MEKYNFYDVFEDGLKLFGEKLDSYLQCNWRRIDYDKRGCKTEFKIFTDDNIIKVYFGDNLTIVPFNFSLEYEILNQNQLKIKNFVNFEYNKAYSEKVCELKDTIIQGKSEKELLKETLKRFKNNKDAMNENIKQLKYMLVAREEELDDINKKIEDIQNKLNFII